MPNLQVLILTNNRLKNLQARSPPRARQPRRASQPLTLREASKCVQDMCVCRDRGSLQSMYGVPASGGGRPVQLRERGGLLLQQETCACRAGGHTPGWAVRHWTWHCYA